MDADAAAPRVHHTLDSLSAEDFETASIHSAAPSYTSEAPSYHSTVPPNEATPAYTPRAEPAHPEPSTLLPPPDPPAHSAAGLPPPAAAPRLPPAEPSLSAFRIASWSTVSSNANPTARHYHSVASRRAAAQASIAAGLRRVMLERIEEEERFHRQQQQQEQPARPRTRPLEDPFLVGEAAARRAREGRLAREGGGGLAADRRWDLKVLGSFARPSNLPSRYLRPLRPAGW